MNSQISYIKNIVENKYGITSPEAYIQYKKDKFDSGLTLDEINKLSPDIIDSGSFWEYIEKESIFNRDAIAYGYKSTDDIDTINAHNYTFACQLGIMNYVFARYNMKMNLLDVGTGYGFLKRFVEKATPFDYYGADVYPKIEGIFKINDCILPDEIMNKKFELVIASNVFQHLSVRQRNIYYEQIAKILHPEFGIFSVSNIHSADGIGFKCIENEKKYICHYGQYTELQSLQELVDDLQKHFHIISSSYLGTSSCAFHCHLRKGNI